MKTEEENTAVATAALFLIPGHPATTRRMRQTLRIVALSPEDPRRPALPFQRRIAAPCEPPNTHTSRALRRLGEWNPSR
jgi:hypothetical protein